VSAEGASAAAAERRQALVELYREGSSCTRCSLAETRQSVVFGAGNADADLMFVGEAPGAEEDRQGLPFVGRAGALLSELLEGIGLDREGVFVTNVLMCLRYQAAVQLGDGSWERVGRLVRSRYRGTVMSVNEEGHLVRRRVIGWHATPLGDRRVYRLSYRSAKNVGATRRVSIELTGDHLVLSEQGFVRADELRLGDRIATGQGLSPLARDVVCGTLLGDGTLQAASSHLSISHSGEQAEYTEFLAQLLAELAPRVSEVPVAVAAGGGLMNPNVQLRTLAHRSLRTLRADFYRSQKVVPSWMERELNERMLAIWFMDDGYIRIRPPRQPRAEIATNCFTDEDLQTLLRGLDRIGLPAKALRGRLHFDVTTTKRLSERIAPYVPQSMRYKLHPEVEARIPFDPGKLKPEPPLTLFDEVEIEDISGRSRADTTFFCIDVEGTHNFVTAGGVVHNCRPPGNRDPKPEEIGSCRPYLERKIDLIEPRVIATLGNFATKLLTASPTGITKVRGTPQVHELGGRTVFVFPVLHPAAALRTPALRETLREDFAKLPELLTQPLPQPIGPPSAPTVEPGATPADDQLDLFG
jgi:uracil-DNA glycosylase